MNEAVEQDPADETEALSPESPDNDEPAFLETPENAEADDEDDAESAEPADLRERVLVSQVSGIDRVQALLTEALRFGQAYGLIERQPDGTLRMPGQTRAARRDTSDCTCPQCHPWAQTHWWCVVCGSGPHDWHLVKPQYERQTLKPGGIEGVRQAACSAQCARDYLASMGRQPSGVQPSREVDPTLGLPW